MNLKKIIKTTLTLAAVLLTLAPAMTVLTGCRDDLLALRERDGYGTLPVSIAIAGMGLGQTRADDAAAEGTEDEYFIDLDDLYVMSFSIEEGKKELSSESRLLEVLWNGKESRLKETETGTGTKTPVGTRIQYNGEVAYLYTQLDTIKIKEYLPKSNKDFCLVAIANFSQFSQQPLNLKEDLKNENGVSTFGALLNKLNYNFKPNEIAGTGNENDRWFWRPYIVGANGTKTTKGIPMFGVKRVSMSGYDKNFHSTGNPYMLSSKALQMLRAFAKVEIKLNDKLTNVKIVSARVNDYAKEFWVIPELNRMEGFIRDNGTGSGDTGDVVKIPGEGYRAQGRTESDKDMQFTVSNDGKSALLYLPEYVINEGQPPNISLSLEIGGVTDNFEFSLAPYNDEGKKDFTSDTSDYWKYLLRNYNYSFCIGLGFNITVNPQPWGDAFDNEFTFGDPPGNEQPNDEQTGDDQTGDEQTGDEQ